MIRRVLLKNTGREQTCSLVSIEHSILACKEKVWEGKGWERFMEADPRRSYQHPPPEKALSFYLWSNIFDVARFFNRIRPWKIAPSPATELILPLQSVNYPSPCGDKQGLKRGLNILSCLKKDVRV